jgi:hypothetical protein
MILPACCARAASGHEAAALPTIVMNSRRLRGYPSSEGLTLAYYWSAAVLCITARSPGPSRLRVRSVELVPFATFPLYLHEPT